ncbi:hypothetical protein, partial [Sphingomonas bacterium]|uniref:hypothetical protein n=1 Tax=Sphingomonas bacterium TaxID=1895847 RepID=UPI0015753DE3
MGRMWRRAGPIVVVGGALVAVAALAVPAAPAPKFTIADPTVADQRRRLVAAKAAGVLATARADETRRAADA